MTGRLTLSCAVGAAAAVTLLLPAVAPVGAQAWMVAQDDETFYFTRFSGIPNHATNELWRSDGTVDGTQPVAVMPTSPDAYRWPSYWILKHLTMVEDRLFFTANDGVHGRELWTSDGTADGTRMLGDNGVAEAYGGPSDLTAFDGALYFVINDHVHGGELWRSDGTPAGTQLVLDLAPTVDGDEDTVGPHGLTTIDDTLYFAAEDDQGHYGIWATDGTAAGTAIVKDLPGAHWIQRLTAVEDTLFFTVDDGTHGYELWASDGTEAGTRLVKDIRPSDEELIDGTIRLTAVGDTLFFVAWQPGTGYGLWRSDGTEEGTFQVEDISPGSDGGGSEPRELTAVNGALYFTARTPEAGRELWRSDGTAAGTEMVKDIEPPDEGNDPSGPTHLTTAGDRLFFVANDGVHGQRLWTSDGSAAGTVMVGDLQPEYFVDDPAALVAVGELLHFTRHDPDNYLATGVWRSDGTAAGTFRVEPVDTMFDPTVAYDLATDEDHVNISFRGTPDMTASFECAQDGSPFTACTSPHTFRNLAPGPHTIQVRAVDGLGRADPLPDARWVVVTPPRSNHFVLPRGDSDPRRGTRTLRVDLPGPGTLTLTPRGRAPVRTQRASAAKAGPLEVTIRPTKKGLARLKARRNHRLSVRVAVTFTPVGGTPRTITHRYVLRLRVPPG